MNLAKKYRPRRFDDVIGQDSTVLVLRAAIVKQRIKPTYIFSGPSGDGKTTCARIFAMAILCASPVDGNPCMECESCKAFLKEQNFGFMELDAASYGGKEDMVKLRDEASFLSVTKKKIILIDEAHDISRQGQDALLKQIEECPDHLVYLFCTTEPNGLRPTLRNRSTIFQLSLVDPALIVERLKTVCKMEEIQADEDALLQLAYKSKGHVRNALNALEDASLLGPVTSESLIKISKDFDNQLCEILLNLGSDINKALSLYTDMAAHINPDDFYRELINIVDDSCQCLYGSPTGMSPSRLTLATKIKDVHGFSLLEFLNYLLSRDKFVDRLGLRSDLLVLHYKFSSGSLQPTVTPAPRTAPQQNTSVQSQSTTQPPSSSPAPLSFNQLMALPESERHKRLREERLKGVSEKQKTLEENKVSKTWDLPRDARPGESSYDDEALSPQEFSKIIVGGRGDGKL